MKLIEQAKQKLHQTPAAIAEALHLTGFWDRLEADRSFRIKARLGGLALLGAGVGLAALGIDMRLEDIQEGGGSTTDLAAAAVGASALSLGSGMVLTLGRKQMPPGPSLAELDALDKATRQPDNVLL